MDGMATRTNNLYRRRDLQKFIELENNLYYRKLNVELVADEEGKLIELQLPHDIDDIQTRRAKER